MLSHKSGQPRSGLEPWLVRKIQHGNLSGLRVLYPNVGGVAERAEPYARQLLTRLRTLDPSSIDYRRARDDGRAFRSWVEAQQPPFALAGSPSNGQARESTGSN
jgi:hypothetical protein